MLKNSYWPKTSPFAQAEESIEKFGSNLYVCHLYQETIDELIMTQKELIAAISNNDNDSKKSQINELEKRVEFLESIVTVASENLSGLNSESGSLKTGHYD